jgi:hypothetical protein
MTDERSEPIDVDAEPAASTGSHLIRSPQTPVTLNEIAALKGEALEVIEARVQVIETLRRASIRATSPPDWILFKSPDEQGGQIVGYLQDAGADRVRDLWGIEVFDVTRPEKVAGNDPAVFTYLISGSGRCKLTRQILEAVEGGRSSTDDFCKGKTGADLELTVRKAARANLDGNITRELAGMKSVPIQEIEAAWVGTTKKIENCRRGRGFGTAAERIGGARAGEPEIDPPKCGVCGAVAKYRAANDKGPAFYGCPNYQQHKDRKWSVKAAEWEAGAAQRAAAAAAAGAPAGGAQAGQAAQGTTNARPAPSGPAAGGRVAHELGADEIPGFGGRRREPGEEG